MGFTEKPHFLMVQYLQIFGPVQRYGMVNLSSFENCKTAVVHIADVHNSI